MSKRRIDIEPTGGNRRAAFNTETELAFLDALQRLPYGDAASRATPLHDLRHGLHLHRVDALYPTDALLVEFDGRAPGRVLLGVERLDLDELRLLAVVAA